jgi:hypothetical protein
MVGIRHFGGCCWSEGILVGQHHESAVVRGSNFEDWSFYMLGAMGAIVSTALKFFFQR